MFTDSYYPLNFLPYDGFYYSSRNYIICVYHKFVVIHSCPSVTITASINMLHSMEHKPIPRPISVNT
jgi:hypothetical protein